MAKVKVVTNNLDYNLNREEFTDFPSQTIFSFGRFAITSNFDGREFIDYNKTLSSFSAPITLDSLKLTDEQSNVILNKTNDIKLNLDKSNFNKFVRFGSAYEYLRVSVEEIILKYPGSVYANNQINGNVVNTFFDFNYNIQQNISTFNIPISVFNNDFGIIYVDGSDIIPDDNILRNLNLSFNDYVVWTDNPNSNNVIASIIGFTGFTQTNQYIRLKTRGNPFDGILNQIPSSGASISFHIKPNSTKFEEFRQQLTDYQKYMISSRTEDGFVFEIKEPTLLDNGNIQYNTINLVWPSSDGYNIRFSGIKYSGFLNRLITIGGKYDAIKTDLIARFLTPTSLKTYDLTEEGKITKLLRVYGWEFDQLRLFIDSLAYVNKITYDKKNNAPDKIISNLAKLFGWEYFSLVNENELVENLLSIDEHESNLNTDFLPVEIDIELWRRIIMNTNYFWKVKGTREAIKAMFLMIGIPAPFINITEYVYTIDEKINPNEVTLQPMDFDSNSYPFDVNGYPIAPPETNDFYFQLSGDTDAGQSYMNNFRQAGFKLEKIVDNKKSWTEDGETIRKHPSTIQYFQKDSKLVLNTKEVDIALDSSRGIEEDVYNYMQQDYAANSSGYTLPISYVNLSLARSGNQNTFTLPNKYNSAEGDIEVRWNGILLNAPSSGNTEELTKSDYFVSGNQITIPALSGISENGGRNVVQVTYVYSGNTNPISGMTVNYVVTRIKPNLNGTKITLPSIPSGDVQLTINGIALTKKTSQFNGDYSLNTSNTGQTDIVINNPDVIAYFLDVGKNPFIQVAYMEVFGTDSVEARSEIHRVDSFNGSKFYFNSYAGKFVYVLNYKINNVENVKILVDGIALEPEKDYTINSSNSSEIYLPRTIKFGSVVTAYYLIGGDKYLDAIIDDIYGLGDITELSFLEFIELVQRKLINARNRKIITDFNGGWYPTLLKIYNDYLIRSGLPDDDPLQSNGYTFQKLFVFLSKYNTFFERFIKQLVSSTIILRKSGLLVRNSVFTRQKFTYKRGVAFNRNNSNLEFNSELNYLGDSGSIFLVPQQATTLTPSLNTIVGVSGRTFNFDSNMYEYSINNTGGDEIEMFDAAERYGLEYRKVGDVLWIDSPNPPYQNSGRGGGRGLGSFDNNIIGLSGDTLYEYRAFIEINGARVYGQIVQTRTALIPTPNPYVNTIEGTANRTYDEDTDTYTFYISGTGGNNIVRGEDAEFYGMLYKTSSQLWVEANCVECNAEETPIVGNEFPMTLSENISASTNYNYTAYITVNGNKTCGFPRTITTCGYIPTIPSVSTGFATGITESSMVITGNSVTNCGYSSINQYGVAWTRVSSLANDTSLRVNESGINYECVNSPINVGTEYSETLNGLSSDTEIWYRAVASNSVGYGYGSIKNQRIRRELNLTINPDSLISGTIDGELLIKKGSDDSVIETVIISNTSNYYNSFILPDEDYYLDVTNIMLYDNTITTPKPITGRLYYWVYGSNTSNGKFSPIFTDETLSLTLNVVPPKT